MMTAEELREHRWKLAGSPSGRADSPAAAFSRETIAEGCAAGAWEEPWTDDGADVHAAWPALVALRALGVHLLAVGDGRVTLGVEAP